MQVGTPRLLLAKQQQIDAGRDYIQALYNYHVARVTFDQILSGRLVLNAQIDTSLPQGNSAARYPDNTGTEGGH